jgi:putative membrane protein
LLIYKLFSAQIFLNCKFSGKTTLLPIKTKKPFLQMDLTPLSGVLLGTLSGLLPGIHPNTVATILSHTSLNQLTTIIYITALTHTFLSTIPAIHLSSPDPTTVLAIHPSQEYSQKGKAHEAVILTWVGSIISLIILIVIASTLQQIIKPTYNTIKPAIPFLILATAIFLIFRQKNKKIATLIFILSGALGLFTLNTEMKEPLLPLFSGLFGVPSLLVNFNSKKTTQKITEPEIDKNSFKTIIKSIIFGSAFSFLPSLGPAQAATVQSQFSKNESKRDYLILIGCLNTINIIVSLITLLEINKARNGAIAIMKTIETVSPAKTKELLCWSLVIALPCTILCLTFSRIFIIIRNKINLKTLSIITILFIISIVTYLSGFKGNIILLISTIIGYIPYKYGITKTTLMGSLMIPTMYFYFSMMLT